MRTEFIKRGILFTLLLIWGARPMLPSLLHQNEIKSQLPENPLSNLRDWIVTTETKLKTLPIRDRENFLKHLEGIKVNFAKLIQVPLQNESAEDFLDGPEADHFYQSLERLFKEKIRLEKNIVRNLETYGLKV